MPVEFTPGGLRRQQSPAASDSNTTPHTRTRQHNNEAHTQAQLREFFANRAETPSVTPRRPPPILLLDQEELDATGDLGRSPTVSDSDVSRPVEMDDTCSTLIQRFANM